MGLFDAVARIWDTISHWLQFIVPGLIIIIIVVIIANIIRGYRSFINDIFEIFRSKWGVLLFVIALVGFYLLWDDIKGVIGW